MALAGDLGYSFANLNAFARIETIDILRCNKESFPEIDLDIAERNFTGSELQANEYENHLQRNTYIACPRGIENYSYRIYEALNIGRIPIIIDTDVALPREIDWERLSVVIPYRSLDRIYEIILEDYRSRSSWDFMERQRSAFATMANLNQMEWVKKLAAQIAAI
jgi:Exostosin family